MPRSKSNPKLVDTPNKVKNWKESFFFVSGNWEFQPTNPTPRISIPRFYGELRKINFTKPKKNLTYVSTPKVVQTKISLKAKSPPPTNGVVNKEPSPNSVRPTQNEVSGKGKEKVMEPPPKVKPTSKQAHSSSKTAQLGSSLGEKRPSSDSISSPAKKLRNYEPVLQPSTMVSSLLGFLSRVCSSLFRAFNKAWEDFSTTMTAR
ncbi:Uncharacterized protein Fot_28519 [Forsythia ovata]|uniref:Uncharacterized protein n=1 Tax=Forsythia ovata TaxID=205694 RepID=A0ABD1TPR4_9LAMI